MFHVVCTPGHCSKLNRFFLLYLTNDSLRTKFFVRKQFFVRAYECSSALKYKFRKGSHMYEFFS